MTAKEKSPVIRSKKQGVRVLKVRRRVREAEANGFPALLWQTDPKWTSQPEEASENPFVWYTMNEYPRLFAGNLRWTDPAMGVLHTDFFVACDSFLRDVCAYDIVTLPTSVALVNLMPSACAVGDY